MNRHEEIVTKQPNAETQIPKAQSSYSTTISMLHTEVSLAVEVNDNVSPKTAPTEAIILDKETAKTKTEVTEEIQNIAAEVSEAPQGTVEAPAEIVGSVKGEIGVQHGSIEKVNAAAALTYDAGVTATSSDSTVVPAEETPVEEAPVQEVAVLTQAEAEKNFSKPEPETHVDMIAEKEAIQTEELPPNDTTEVTYEKAGLKNTGEVSSMDNSSTEPDSSVLAQSESDVTGKSVAEVTAEEPVTEPTAEVEDKRSEETHSEMAEQGQETSEPIQTQEHLQEGSSPGMNITNALAPAIENGLVKDSENERNADVVVVEKLPQEEDIVQKPNEETMQTESQEQLPSKPSTQTDR